MADALDAFPKIEDLAKVFVGEGTVVGTLFGQSGPELIQCS